MNNRLSLTFEGPLIGDHGVPLDDLVNTVTHLQRAIRILIREFEGIEGRLGRPPQVVVEQSTLRLVGTSPGSVITDWELTPPVGVQPSLVKSGERAVQTIFDQGETSDGRANSLSPTVVAELDEIANDLSVDVNVVKITSPNSVRSIEFRRPATRKPDTTEPAERVETKMSGRLLEVNWDRCTAQLHRYSDKYVRLTFDPGLGEDMQRLATQFVVVHGQGSIDDADSWKQFEVDRLEPTQSWAEPFDLDAVLNDPNRKVFRRDQMVTASEPFDVVEFNRIVRQGRLDT